MARQGHRVWLARLTFAAAVLVVLAFGARWLWLRWSLGEVEPVVAAAPLPDVPKGTEREGNPHPLDPVLELASEALEQHRTIIAITPRL